MEFWAAPRGGPFFMFTSPDRSGFALIERAPAWPPSLRSWQGLGSQPSAVRDRLDLSACWRRSARFRFAPVNSPPRRPSAAGRSVDRPSRRRSAGTGSPAIPMLRKVARTQNGRGRTADLSINPPTKATPSLEPGWRSNLSPCRDRRKRTPAHLWVKQSLARQAPMPRLRA